MNQPARVGRTPAPSLTRHLLPVPSSAATSALIAELTGRIDLLAGQLAAVIDAHALTQSALDIIAAHLNPLDLAARLRQRHEVVANPTPAAADALDRELLPSRPSARKDRWICNAPSLSAFRDTCDGENPVESKICRYCGWKRVVA